MIPPNGDPPEESRLKREPLWAARTMRRRRSRSGLALRHQVTILNAPGTIDSDYRGELQIILINLGNSPFIISRGERIAQLVAARVERAELELRTELGDTDRGAGGFGHSGR